MKCKTCPARKRCSPNALGCCFAQYSEECGEMVSNGYIRRYSVPCAVRKLCKACSGAGTAIAILEETQ